MEALRHWSVRHARGLKRLYDACARTAPYFAPLMRQIGPARTERLLAPLERATKGFLFDCKMCGQCVLSSTGMTCPTNCAKQMRNGPCGGVRPDGHCEVLPEMPCVWVQAVERSQICRREDATYFTLQVEQGESLGTRIVKALTPYADSAASRSRIAAGIRRSLELRKEWYDGLWRLVFRPGGP